MNSIYCTDISISEQPNGVRHIFSCQILSPTVPCMQRKGSNGTWAKFTDVEYFPIKLHLVKLCTCSNGICASTTDMEQILQASLECVSIAVQTTQEYDMQEHRYKAVVINFISVN